jgi:hypothetical protein
MAKAALQPFKNESDTEQIGDLSIENRLDRLSLFGSLDLTLDREGLAAARALKTLLDRAIAEMEQTDLPDRIAIEKPETVKNPFS